MLQDQMGADYECSSCRVAWAPTSVTIQGGSKHTPMKRTTFGCLMALIIETCISNADHYADLHQQRRS